MTEGDVPEKLIFPSVIKRNHAAYYPFIYYIKWQTKKKETKFGELIKDEWKAICNVVSQDDSIWLHDSQHFLEGAFDCVYFHVESYPGLSPYEVLETIKRSIFPIIIAKYPNMRNELAHDSWFIIDRSKTRLKNIAKRDFPEMEYIPYYFRFWVKFNTHIFDESINGIKISDSLEKSLTETISYLNAKYSKPIDILWKKIHSNGLELTISAPIDFSASKLSGLIKSNVSRRLRNTHPEIKDRRYFNSPYYVNDKAFWTPGNFYGISPHPIRKTPEWKINKYLELYDLWKSTKGETNRIRKGRMLESFICQLFELSNIFVPSLDHDKYNRAMQHEEIDIPIKNRSNSRIIKDCGSIILVECKNWSSNVGNDEIRDFSSKLRGKINTGFMISVNGFGKFEDHILTRLYYNDKFIITITGNDIEYWLKEIVSSYNYLASQRKSLDFYLEGLFERMIEDKLVTQTLFSN